MARDFNGTSDKITSTLATGQKALTQITVSHIFSRDTAGEVGYGQVWAMEDAGGTRNWLVQNDNGDGGWGIIFRVDWGTREGVWSCPLPGDTNQHVYTATYDGSSVNNDAVWYKDGVSQTVTERVAPSGTLPSDETILIIGNRSNQSETWDGKISEFAIWNRILSPSECAGLGKGYSPLFFPNGLVFYMPIIGNASPEPELRMGSNGTLTGTTKVAHPRIIYPSFQSSLR